MGAKVFLDTNVLVYFFSRHEPLKRRKALKAIVENDCVTGINNINELANVLGKKYAIRGEELKNSIRQVISKVSIVPLDVQTILAAVDIRDRYQYAHFDSLIVASALESGCSSLFTEDMHHGQSIHGKLTINNIFRETDDTAAR